MPLSNDQLQPIDPLQQALLMAQMGQPTAPSHNPGEVQAAMIQALMQQRRADDMYQRPPRRMEQMGWGSALSELARPFVAKRNEKKANEELAAAMGKQGDLDRYDAALAEYQAGIKDAQKAIDERSKFERQESYKTTQKNAEIPDKQKIAEYIMSKPPEERDYWTKIMGAGGVTVNTGDTPQSAQQMANLEAIKTRTGNMVNSQQALIDRGEQARRSIPSFNMGLQLLDKVDTGKPLTEELNYAKRFASSLGADIDLSGVTNYEQLAPVFGQFLFQGIQNTKGAISNKEMEVFAKLGPNYNYTTEGNRRLLTYSKKQAERDVKIRDMVVEMSKQNRSPMEISDAVDKYVDSNDLSAELNSLVSEKQSKVINYEDLP